MIPLKKFGGVKIFIVARRTGGVSMFLDKAARKHDKLTGTDWYRLKKLKENMRALEFEHVVQNAKGNFAAIYSPAKGEFYPMRVEETYSSQAPYSVPVMEEVEAEEMQTIRRKGRLKEGEPREIQVPRKVIKTVQKVDKEGNPVFETRYVEVRGLLEPVNEDQKMFLITEHERAAMRFGKQGFWEKMMPIIAPLTIAVAFAVIFLFGSMFMEQMVSGAGTASGILKEVATLMQGVRPLMP